MRLSAPLYLFDQKDSSLKVVPLGSDWYFIPDGVMLTRQATVKMQDAAPTPL
jgi:hypothetical protein